MTYSLILKKNWIALALALLPVVGFAQVKVGDNLDVINPNSILEIEATDKGVLLPRVALTGTANAAPLSAHISGMIVYNTAATGDVTPGFYYNDGSAWVRGSGSTSSFFIQEDGNTPAAISSGETINFASGANMNISRSGNTLTFNSSFTNTQLSQEQVQDFVGSMVSGNTENGITVTYDDTGNHFDFVAADNSATNELQTLSISGNTLSISGGNNVNIPVGMSNFRIREDNGAQETIDNGELITLLSGSNMNIVRTGTNTFQFNATNTNTQLSQEQVQDYVGSMVSGNTENGITVTYDDGGNHFDFVAADNSATNELQTLFISGNTLSISGGNSVTLPSSSGFWSLNGNAASSANFIGTTNQ